MLICKTITQDFLLFEPQKYKMFVLMFFIQQWHPLCQLMLCLAFVYQKRLRKNLPVRWLISGGVAVAIQKECIGLHGIKCAKINQMGVLVLEIFKISIQRYWRNNYGG